MLVSPAPPVPDGPPGYVLPPQLGGEQFVRSFVDIYIALSGNVFIDSSSL